MSILYEQRFATIIFNKVVKRHFVTVQIYASCNIIVIKLVSLTVWQKFTIPSKGNLYNKDDFVKHLSCIFEFVYLLQTIAHIPE